MGAGRDAPAQGACSVDVDAGVLGHDALAAGARRVGVGCCVPSTVHRPEVRAVQGGRCMMLGMTACLPSARVCVCMCAYVRVYVRVRV